MSGSLIGGIAGAALGFLVPGVGVALGFALGSTAGSLLFPGSLPTQYGPRLEDLRPQTSEYGKPIPIVYGTVGMGGNVIWASDYIEVENKTEQGGKGGPSQTSITYSYFGNFAVAFAEGPNTIGRMWAGPSKRLIYDGAVLEGGGTVRIYPGTEDQLPDPLIESYEGAGNVPAFRGTTVVVFEMFPLAEDGNAIPFIVAEVGAKGGTDAPPPVYLGQGAPVPANTPAMAVVDSTSGWVWSVTPEVNGDSLDVVVVSDEAEQQIAPLSIPSVNVTPVGVCAVPSMNEIWVVTQQFASSACNVFIFDGGAADAEGLATTEPTFKEMVTIPGITYPAAVTYDAGRDRVIIAGSFSNITTMTLYAVSVTGRTVALQNASMTGYPEYLITGGDYIGVSMLTLAAPFDVFSADSLALVHSSDLVAVPSGRSRYVDFDSTRDVFVAVSGPGSYTIIDPATGEESSYTLTIPAGTPETPPPSSNVLTATYVEAVDKYFFGADGATGGAGAASTVFVVSPTSNTTEAVYTYETGGGMLLSPLLAPKSIAGGAPYLISFDGENVKRLYAGGSVTAAPIGLGAIVADLSERAGQPYYDVSQLTDSVPGYAIARQTAVRAAIDALRPAYYFDAVESGGLVKFVKRGGAAAAVIDDNDLDAHQADGQPGDPLLTTRQMEVELPKVVNVNYLLAATDYEKATQTYSRQIGSSQEETTLDLPLVLTDAKGQEVAQVNCHVPWVQRLKYGPFSLPRKYSYLEPTDIITVRGYEMMLEKITATPGGVLTCEAVATDSSHYTPHVVVTETVPTEKIVYIPGETVLELM